MFLVLKTVIIYLLGNENKMRYKAPLEEHKFIKLVKSFGYEVISSSKHHKIVDINEDLLMVFAISHSKKGKREVKPVYINLFLNKLQKER